MPNYDYHCASCGHKEEILQKMTEAPLTECPQCHQTAFKRQFGTGIGLQFQGSGFYCNDYGTSNKAPSSSEKDATSPPSPPATSGGCGCGKNACSS